MACRQTPLIEQSHVLHFGCFVLQFCSSVRFSSVRFSLQFLSNPLPPFSYVLPGYLLTPTISKIKHPNSPRTSRLCQLLVGRFFSALCSFKLEAAIFSEPREEEPKEEEPKEEEYPSPKSQMVSGTSQELRVVRRVLRTRTAFFSEDSWLRHLQWIFTKDSSLNLLLGILCGLVKNWKHF